MVPTAKYRALDYEEIAQTLEGLHSRISERFPDSGLRKVCAELIAVGKETNKCVAYLRAPHRPTRVFVGLAILAMIVIGVMAAVAQGLPERKWSEFESARNSLVFLGVAMFFLLSIEPRIKRRRALSVVHQLRSLAHVIDMHQLAKDPKHLLAPEIMDASSLGEQNMTTPELARYLDYCSDLLSVTSKLSALLVQYFNDPVLLGAVDEIETLTTGLSGKIWQKIQLLDAGRVTA